MLQIVAKHTIIVCPKSSYLASVFPGKLHHIFYLTICYWGHYSTITKWGCWILKIHWPVRMKKGSVGFKPENLVQPDIPSTWKALEALYDSGKTRAIGVSNFSSKKLEDLIKVARVPPAVIQVECHPSWQQTKLHAFCKSNGVHLSVSRKIFNWFYLLEFFVKLISIAILNYLANELAQLTLPPSIIMDGGWDHWFKTLDLEFLLKLLYFL